MTIEQAAHVLAQHSVPTRMVGGRLQMLNLWYDSALGIDLEAWQDCPRSYRGLLAWLGY